MNWMHTLQGILLLARQRFVVMCNIHKIIMYTVIANNNSLLVKEAAKKSSSHGYIMEPEEPK